MRVSLNEIRDIENHLLSDGGPEALVFEARLILDDELKDKVERQKNVYAMVNAYGRQKAIADIRQVHDRLFEGRSSFGKRIRDLFKNK